MYWLPTEIEINNAVYHIREAGDFRMVIDCFGALQDEELDTEYRIYTALLIFYEEFNDITDVIKSKDTEELVKQMFWFFNCGEPEAIENESKPNYKLIDWDLDSQLIASAINAVARTEIRTEKYIHWWTFMGYYNAIGECPLSTIVSIRKKVIEGKKLEKYEREFKHENPQYFNRDFRSVTQKELDNKLKELWNSD